MGSDLPFRDTFISTRGPVRSNAAASPRAMCGMLAHKNAANIRAQDVVRIRLGFLACRKNTSAPYSGLGGGFFCRSSTAPSIIARQKQGPTLLMKSFPRLRTRQIRELVASLGLRGVISLARKDLVFLARRFDTHLAKSSVLCRVRRIVAHGVLAAELFGNLVKGFVQLLFRRYFDSAATGFITQF